MCVCISIIFFAFLSLRRSCTGGELLLYMLKTQICCTWLKTCLNLCVLEKREIMSSLGCLIPSSALLGYCHSRKHPKSFFFSFFFLASAFVYTPKVTLELCLCEKKKKIKWLLHRALIHSFVSFVRSDHLKCWSWMPLSEQTSVRSHLMDQLVLQRPSAIRPFSIRNSHFIFHWTEILKSLKIRPAFLIDLMDFYVQFFMHFT